MIALPNRFKKIGLLAILKNIQNGGDMVDGTEIVFFGISAINLVAFNGCSNPARVWKVFLKF
jgi:hypothetical protein